MKNFTPMTLYLQKIFIRLITLRKLKKIYDNLGKKGKAFKWHASKQLAKIYIQEENKDKALELVRKAYNNLANKDIYETFDYAEFLKNNEKFEESFFTTPK